MPISEGIPLIQKMILVNRNVPGNVWNGFGGTGNASGDDRNGPGKGGNASNGDRVVSAKVGMTSAESGASLTT